MTPSPFIPGDLVRRTGETAMGIVHGETYVVLAVEASPRAYITFAEALGVEFRPGGFSLVQRAEGKS